jgi:dihydroorotate dehydrogenase (fumarate)
MIDLTTHYLGLTLSSPLVCSSSPLCQDLDAIARMEEVGAAAVVLHSLFEEQIELQSLDLSRCPDHGAEVCSEAQSFFPDMADYNLGLDGYLEHIRQAKSLVNIPIIASLNGYTQGGWLRYSQEIQQAGADALELNVYEIPTDPHRGSAEVEQDLVDLVSDVASRVSIPVAVKLSPYYSAPLALARRLDKAGAKGLVLFNRFYQPDFDLERLEVVPSLWLSVAEELRLRLHWAALMWGRVHADLAVTGGVHTAADVLKVVLAGGSVAMMTSALLRHGIEHLAVVRAGILDWLEEHEQPALGSLRGGMSFRSVANPAVFERANYMKVLREPSLHRGQF